MTGLRKFGTKDLGAIVDAAERYSVGLDDVFYRLHSYGMGTPKDSYPPYNLVQESNIKWRIELALAGWSKDEFEVSTESNVLLIRSKAAKNKGEEEYMHEVFPLAPSLEVSTCRMMLRLVQSALQMECLW